MRGQRNRVDGTARRRLRQLSAVSLGVLALGAGLIMLAAPAAAAPGLSVTPSSGLSDGQSVSVYGTGFAANATNINVVQCQSGSTGPNSCNIAGGQFFQHTNGSGAFTVSITVKASFGSVNCTKVTCMIVAHAGTDPNSGDTAMMNLSFGAATSSSSAASTPPAGGSSTPQQGSSSTPGSGVEATGATGANPTGANTGHGVDTNPPLLAGVLAALGALLLVAGLGASRVRSRRAR